MGHIYPFRQYILASIFLVTVLGILTTAAATEYPIGSTHIANLTVDSYDHDVFTFIMEDSIRIDILVRTNGPLDFYLMDYQGYNDYTDYDAEYFSSLYKSDNAHRWNLIVSQLDRGSRYYIVVDNDIIAYNGAWPSGDADYEVDLKLVSLPTQSGGSSGSSESDPGMTLFVLILIFLMIFGRPIIRYLTEGGGSTRPSYGPSPDTDHRSSFKTSPGAYMNPSPSSRGGESFDQLMDRIQQQSSRPSVKANPRSGSDFDTDFGADMFDSTTQRSGASGSVGSGSMTSASSAISPGSAGSFPGSSANVGYEGDGPPCNLCGRRSTLIPQYKSNYCYTCERYI